MMIIIYFTICHNKNNKHYDNHICHNNGVKIRIINEKNNLNPLFYFSYKYLIFANKILVF